MGRLEEKIQKRFMECKKLNSVMEIEKLRLVQLTEPIIVAFTKTKEEEYDKIEKTNLRRDDTRIKRATHYMISSGSIRFKYLFIGIKNFGAIVFYGPKSKR